NTFLNLGGWLLNRDGQRFMEAVDPIEMERTTRDRVALGIGRELLEGRGWSDNLADHVVLSMAHLSMSELESIRRSNPLFPESFFRLASTSGVPCFPAC